MKPARSALAITPPMRIRPPRKKKKKNQDPGLLLWSRKVGGKRKIESIAHTLKRRETTVHDQLEITQLALREHDGGEGLGLSGELSLAGSIAGKQVLEDTTVGSVGHCEE